MKDQRKRKSQARLVGFSESGALVFEQVVPLDAYWDESHPVIDDAVFRCERSIRKLVGWLYGPDGELIEEFENTYDDSGKLRTSGAN
jgi:hypothetical protein